MKKHMTSAEYWRHLDEQNRRQMRDFRLAWIARFVIMILMAALVTFAMVKCAVSAERERPGDYRCQTPRCAGHAPISHRGRYRA